MVKTEFLSDGTSNKIDGLDFWKKPADSKWSMPSKPWWNNFFAKDFFSDELYFVPHRRFKSLMKRMILPPRWVRYADKNSLPTYYELDHDVDLEWCIPRDAGFEEIFSRLAVWWGDSGRVEVETNVFRIWQVEPGEDEYRMIYKPTGLILEWYKYPFRSSTTNRRFSRQELRNLVGNCMISVNLNENQDDEGNPEVA